MRIDAQDDFVYEWQRPHSKESERLKLSWPIIDGVTVRQLRHHSAWDLSHAFPTRFSALCYPAISVWHALPSSHASACRLVVDFRWHANLRGQADQALNREIIRLACELLDHDSLKGEPVGIIIEFQLYFKEFWDLRKITHIWYKVGRPDNLDSKPEGG